MIYFILIIIELLIILLLLVIHFIINNLKHRNPIIVEYRAIETERESKQLHSFLDYISIHFYDCELTLEQVSQQTGINHRRIANFIQQNFDCNFKTYLNRIRIQESKRLLEITEFSIGEIAFKVGFSNQSYFNHVFKSMEGISPKTFRDSLIKN